MAKTVSEGFQSKLHKIQPLPGEYQKATSHKSSVKSCVENNFGCYTMFETGSFGNGTAVKHYSDTDYFVPIPVKSLSTNSATALRVLKDALQATFPRTANITVSSPAVKVPFGQYASETLEITPCRFVEMINTPIGNFPYYAIPDGEGGWMFSSPQAHTKYVNSVNDKLGGKLKPVIQLLKAWKFELSPFMFSFYLELSTTQLLENTPIFAYDEALLKVLEELYRRKLASIKDPMGISKRISACKSSGLQSAAFSRLQTALGRAEKACNARAKNNAETAFEYWHLFFHGSFPSYR